VSLLVKQSSTLTLVAIMVSFTASILTFAAIASSLAVPLDGDLVSRSPDFILEPESYLNLTRRQSYSSDYTTGGTVNYSPGSAGSYSVTFSGASDFVVGKC
jgi:endo-1,4-beta-xylanase